MSDTLSHLFKNDSDTSKISEDEYHRLLSSKFEQINKSVSKTVEDVHIQKTKEAIENNQYAGLIDKHVLFLDVLKDLENTIFECANLIISKKRISDFYLLFTALKTHVDAFPKARMAKITTALIESVNLIDGCESAQIDLCKKICEWYENDVNSFVRHTLETKLLGFYVNLCEFNEASNLLKSLIPLVKKNDDKLLLLELHILESKLHMKDKNVAKIRAALTDCKTLSNSINCPQTFQVEIDIISGCVHCIDDDFITANSYFHEAFDAYVILKDVAKAEKTFIYILLSDLLNNKIPDMNLLTLTDIGLKLISSDNIIFFSKIIQSFRENNLTLFHELIQTATNIFKGDPFLLDCLFLISKKLVRKSIADETYPYSQVEIEHVANKIGLTKNVVEIQIAQMILDGVMNGMLDQQNGTIVIFPQIEKNENLKESIAICNDLSFIVDKLSKNIKILDNN